ncbi:retrovirus-related pol polyprotein from transposon TNT 1-94 [Tanacetum coccineum]
MVQVKVPHPQLALSPQDAQAPECILVHDPPAPWDQVHTSGERMPASVAACKLLVRSLRWNTPDRPLSEQTYRYGRDGVPLKSQSKSVEISDLKLVLEKVLVITDLKDDLRKLKGKALVDNDVTKHPSDPEMLKIDVEPITPKLLNKKTAHSAYIKHIQEEAIVLRDLVEHVKSKYPLISFLRIYRRVKPSTSACGSQPSGNTKKDKIRQTPSSTQKNKQSSKRKVWKPTGKVFTNIGYIWRPTGRTFTIVGNACPLTRITSNTEVPFRKSTALENETSKPVVTLVYSRKPRKSKTNVPVSKSKVLKSVSANKMEPSQSWGSIVSDVPFSFLNEYRYSNKFRNDHVVKILGYGDYQIGNVTILRKEFEHKLELETTNLYTLSLGDMMTSSPICLLSKASKTKFWLWHRRLSHLNINAINHLARHGVVRGLPKLKFEKEHLCSACAMGKSTKKPHKPKSEDTNKEKLYLLHMDLCGPMLVASVNGKKYILVIVDYYSRFTWLSA